MDLDEPKRFGQLLRRHRRAAGLTQAALAARAGISERAIQDLEGGRRQPLLDTLRRLLSALRLTEDEQAELTASVLPGVEPSGRADSPTLTPGVLSNLPAPLTSFVGREWEVAEVTRLFADVRLLTLTGPPGVGKTRLAQEVVSVVGATFPGGVAFVSLASVDDPGLALPTIARVLGVHEVGNRPLIETVRAALRDREALLVLDNCEHLVGACAQLVEAVLAGCAGVRVLATSRQPLELGGEAVWTVPPLDTPPSQKGLSAGDLLAFDAVRLFADRAGAALPGFALDNSDAEAAARVCGQVDGLPLAIELAAAWARVLTLPDLADRLGRRLELLVGGSQTALPRHRTLRATMDWSHDLLSAKERALMRRLAVFAGGWTLGSAEAVCPGPGRDGRGDGFAASEALPLLRGLVDKSLVVVEQDRAASTRGDGASGYRYRFLETIREYALERLAESGEDGDAHDRHAAYYARLVEPAERGLFGPGRRAWLDALDRDHDNLRAALRRCLDTARVETGLRLAGALGWFWYFSGHHTEGAAWLAPLLAGREGRGPARAKALVWAGSFAGQRGDAATARALLEESLALGRELRDDRAVALSLNLLAHQVRDAGDDEAARRLLEEAVAICRALGDPVYLGWLVESLGCVVARLGEYAEATALLEESLHLARQLGSEYDVAQALEDLGLVAAARGDDGLARERWEEALSRYREGGDRAGMATAHIYLGRLDCRHGNYAATRAHFVASLELMRASRAAAWISQALHGLAALAAAQGQPGRALRLAGASAALRETRAIGPPPLKPDEWERAIEPARGAVDPAAAADAWAQGQAMSLDRAIAYALEDDTEPATTRKAVEE